MNGIFFALVLIAFLVAGWRQITWVPPSIDAVSPMQTLANGMVETAGSSVTLAIGLIGELLIYFHAKDVPEFHIKEVAGQLGKETEDDEEDSYAVGKSDQV